MENQTEEEKILKKISRKISSEKKDNVIYTSFLETEEYILEQVYVATVATCATSATDTKFCIFDRKTASITFQDNFLLQGKEYCPIVDEILLNQVILLPSKPEEFGDTGQLIKDIKRYLEKNIELPKFYNNFLPYIVLFYWAYDKFPFIPYIHFVGLTGTGKTTAQEVLGSICYKPIDASGAITMSPIFRTASQWRGTLLLDEFEPDSEGYKEMLAFLKSGVSNKAVLRTEGDKKREVRAYLIKCPKIFTSEKPTTSSGLRSRMFVVQMEKNKKRVPLYRLKQFQNEALHLRNKLLMWRFKNIDNIDLSKLEYGFPELLCFDGRVQQVITPLYYFSDEETRKEIVKFGRVQEAATKKERQDSLEGQIFQIIVDILPAEPTLKYVTEQINKERIRRPYTERRVASIIRTILLFEIEREGHENIRTIKLERKEERIKELKEYFGIVSVQVAEVAAVAAVANGEAEQ